MHRHIASTVLLSALFASTVARASTGAAADIRYGGTVSGVAEGDCFGEYRTDVPWSYTFTVEGAPDHGAAYIDGSGNLQQSGSWESVPAQLDIDGTVYEASDAGLTLLNGYAPDGSVSDYARLGMNQVQADFLLSFSIVQGQGDFVFGPVADSQGDIDWLAAGSSVLDFFVDDFATGDTCRLQGAVAEFEPAVDRSGGDYQTAYGKATRRCSDGSVTTDIDWSMTWQLSGEPTDSYRYSGDGWYANYLMWSSTEVDLSIGDQTWSVSDGSTGIGDLDYGGDPEDYAATSMVWYDDAQTVFASVAGNSGDFIEVDWTSGAWSADWLASDYAAFSAAVYDSATGLNCSYQGDIDGIEDWTGVVPADTTDSDGDGVPDDEDACPDDPSTSVLSTWYADFDGDGWGDAADGVSDCSAPDGYVAVVGDCDDDDGSSFPGASEVCDGADNDCDGVVNDDELDLDGDGFMTCAGDCDDLDDTVGDTLTWYADDDGDGLGDSEESVSAGCEAPDGYVADASDLCPIDPENDGDGDGLCESDDNCPVDANADQVDNDADGEGDACDLDDDDDGVLDGADNCQFDANADQADTDSDGAGDVCDDDLDGDGVLDAEDSCLGYTGGEPVDASGCSIEQLCPCDNGWKNHGAYVSCVAGATNDFADAGLISQADKGDIQSDAGASECGHKSK